MKTNQGIIRILIPTWQTFQRWMAAVLFINWQQNQVTRQLHYHDLNHMILFIGALWHQHIEAGQNGGHFTDDIVKRIFWDENVWISLNISLKFVRKVPISNIQTLAQIMAWRRPGDKPLSEPMIVYWRIYALLGLNELMTLSAQNSPVRRFTTQSLMLNCCNYFALIRNLKKKTVDWITCFILRIKCHLYEINFLYCIACSTYTNSVNY